MTWESESTRHSLASKGISTDYKTVLIPPKFKGELIGVDVGKVYSLFFVKFKSKQIARQFAEEMDKILPKEAGIRVRNVSETGDSMVDIYIDRDMAQSYGVNFTQFRLMAQGTIYSLTTPNYIGMTLPSKKTIK